MGDGVSVIQPAWVGRIKVPYGFTVTNWEIVTDQIGSIEFNVFYATYADFPNGTGWVSPSISNARKGTGTSGFTTMTVPAGCWIIFYVASCSSICQATLSFQVKVNG